jgi:DNA-binding FadR family transcriptional regulator
LFQDIEKQSKKLFNLFSNVVLEYLKSNHENLVKDYLEERKNFEALFFYYLENFFQTNLIERRRACLRDAKNCLKLLENNKEFDYKFYKTYLDDLENSLIFKKELLIDNTIKQTDTSNFDNATFDNYRALIKCEKMGMVELKNKTIFQVF